MKINKHLLIAVALGVSMSMGTCFATNIQNNVDVNVNMQQNVQGLVNWDKGSDADIEAWGVGLAPVNMYGPRGTALARRAAIVDAYRQLAELVQGVQVDAETTMRDLSIENDVVRTKTQALVKGARIIGEKVNTDGSYTVKMAIPLYGVKSVAAIAVPEAQKAVLPETAPEITESYVPTPEVKAEAASYTGVIVDAAGLGLEGTFSPVIYDVNGRAIYGMRNIDKDFAISHGMVEYSNDLQAASANSRAGANPLVVKAVSVRGGGNSVNPVNVVVSVEDGDKILYANEKSSMLENKAVVFVK